MSGYKEVNRDNLKHFNIYAGLGGSFGGASYQFTTLCETEEEANVIAYEYAKDRYEEYEGYHGIRSYQDIAEDEGLDPEKDIEELDCLYNEEVESWIDYYAVLTSEDGLDENELILDYVIEDADSEG